MKFLFDTDVISTLLRSEATTRLNQRLARTPLSAQCTSSITLGELAYGAERVGRPQLYARARRLLDDVEILTFDGESAEVYGRLRAQLEKKGRLLAEADLRIASIAVAHECTLVTGNLRHFARIEGLLVEDWLAD